jgi:hypothetical protein
MVQLVKKSTYRRLKVLETQPPAVYATLGTQIALGAYTRETVSQESAGRNREEKRTKKPGVRHVAGLGDVRVLPRGLLGRALHLRQLRDTPHHRAGDGWPDGYRR